MTKPTKNHSTKELGAEQRNQNREKQKKLRRIELKKEVNEQV